MTLFEMSCEEWMAETGGTRSAWSLLTVSEWRAIVTELTASGHWHDGRSCDEAHCKPRDVTA